MCTRYIDNLDQGGPQRNKLSIPGFYNWERKEHGSKYVDSHFGCNDYKGNCLEAVFLHGIDLRAPERLHGIFMEQALLERTEVGCNIENQTAVLIF
jgi:hypothetical protein